MPFTFHLQRAKDTHVAGYRRSANRHNRTEVPLLLRAFLYEITHHGYGSSDWLCREETLNKNMWNARGQPLLLFGNVSSSLTRFSIFKVFLSTELRQKLLASFHVRQRTAFEKMYCQFLKHLHNTLFSQMRDKTFQNTLFFLQPIGKYII